MYLFRDEIRVSGGWRGETVIAKKMMQPSGAVPKPLSTKCRTRPNFMINQILSANPVGARELALEGGWQ